MRICLCLCLSLSLSLFFCGARDQTQGLVHARQVLYAEMHLQLLLFRGRVSLSSPGWPGIYGPPSAGITVVYQDTQQETILICVVERSPNTLKFEGS
jgi:hypothetical protein